MRTFITLPVPMALLVLKVSLLLIWTTLFLSRGSRQSTGPRAALIGKGPILLPVTIQTKPDHSSPHNEIAVITTVSLANLVWAHLPNQPTSAHPLDKVVHRRLPPNKCQRRNLNGTGRPEIRCFNSSSPTILRTCEKHSNLPPHNPGSLLTNGHTPRNSHTRDHVARNSHWDVSWVCGGGWCWWCWCW